MTWRETIMILSLSVILILLVFAGFGLVAEQNRNRLQRNRNLKIIMLALNAYTQEHNGLFPSRHHLGEPVSPGEWRNETLSLLAGLAVWSGGDIGAKDIWSHSGWDALDAPPTWDGSSWRGHPLPVAIDWSAPGYQAFSSVRPIIGNRSPELFDGKGINVVFGDGHQEWVTASPGMAETPPMSGDRPIPYAVIVGTKHPDDLLKGSDDAAYGKAGSRMSTVGKGSTTRAFLK